MEVVMAVVLVVMNHYYQHLLQVLKVQLLMADELPIPTPADYAILT